MSAKTFDEFVNEQVAHADELKSSNEISWPHRLENWRFELEKLYSDMEKYLREYISDGKIKKQLSKITITEPNVESYEVEQLIFHIGTEKVVAKPIGTQLIGAKGRVDLIGRRGSIKIVLLEKGGPTLNITTSVPGHIAETHRGSMLHNSTVDKEGWYITSPPPRITATALSKGSFKEAIMELADVWTNKVLY